MDRIIVRLLKLNFLVRPEETICTRFKPTVETNYNHCHLNAVKVFTTDCTRSQAFWLFFRFARATRVGSTFSLVLRH